MGFQMNFLNSFINHIEKNSINIYGIMIYKNGSIVSEHYFKPDEPRNIYSVSKSFSVTAIGKLIDEGLLHLSDRPIDFFNQQLPVDIYPGYDKLNLEHLLTMSSGHGRAILHEPERKTTKEKDWIRFLLSQPLVSDPGKKFMYSNGSSFLAGCMAEKASGVKLIDYLYETTFAPMGIPYPEWDECPMGHTFAASTLRLKLSDMIKLGILYLNGGEYEGKRLVSKEWVDKATSFKIASEKISKKGTGLDEEFGYGYHFWRCSHPGAYRAFGRLGQFVIVIPSSSLVIATSAHEENEQSILDAIWNILLPELQV